jgi:hypothetical protein
MSWDGYCALGTYSSPTFTESTAGGYQRLPYSWRDPHQDALQGGGQPLQFSTTDTTATGVNALGFFLAATGGTPVFVYPLRQTVSFGPNGLRVSPYNQVVHMITRRTGDGVICDMDPAPLAGLPTAVPATSPTLANATLTGATTFGDATQDQLIITPSSPVSTGVTTFSHTGSQGTGQNFFTFDSGLTVGAAAQNAIVLQPGGAGTNFANINLTGTVGLRIQTPNTGATQQIILGNLSNNYISLSIGATPGTNVTTIGPPAGGSVRYNLGPSGAVLGSTDGASVVAGGVGEVMSINVVSGSAVPVTTATFTQIATLALTPGDWDVTGTVGFTNAGATTTWAEGYISTAQPPASPGNPPLSGAGYKTTVAIGSDTLFSVGRFRALGSSTINVYLGCYCVFPSGTISAYGYMSARRQR